MDINRRHFLQTTAAGIAFGPAAARAGDPFAPANPGLTAKWFDKGKQHVLPGWAFSLPFHTSPTPMPVVMDTWERLSGGESHSPTTVFAGVDEKDKVGVGKVLHGTAVEWNGNLIGGNKKLTATGWKPAASAWDAMKARVTPSQGAEGYGISDQRNWGKFAGGGGEVGEEGKNCLVRCYRIEMFEKLLKLRLDAKFPALLYTYAGLVPGPTFRFRHGMPCVVRFVNKLQTEVSIHHHGGHNPTHGDGFPSYYVLQGEARDYLYPNILPLRDAGEKNGKQVTEIDFGEGQSTTWYHDHGLDATAFNVAHGLSGFALWFDDLELDLIRKGVLPAFGVIRDSTGKIINPSVSGFDPDLEKAELAKAWGNWKAASPASPWSKRHDLAIAGSLDPEERTDIDLKGYYREATTPYFNPYDIPIALQDRVINQDTGQIIYDSNGHNGYIGNTMLISGVAWPVARVKRRKYRLRILDGSNSRIFRLRFLDGDTFGLRPTGAPNGEREPAPIPAATLEARAMEFLRIGKDSWLWAMPQKCKSLILNMANRADLIVDFKAWYKESADAGRLVPHPDPEKKGQLVAEYYLVNTMPQFDGRGPKTKLAEDAGDPAVFPLPFTLNPTNPVVNAMRNEGVIPAAFLDAGAGGQISELDQPVGLMKFIIENDEGEGDDATIDETTILRPRHAIKDDEVMAVREFNFERGKGAWVINGRFYDPTISNASTVIGVKGQEFRVPDGSKPAEQRETRQSLTYAEEWILRNGGGGWWHPIHIHLEGHQLVSYQKDFEADGFVGADGILGAAAQAQMAGLPDWNALVGRFGFDPLLAAGGTQADLIREVRDLLMGGPGLRTLLATELAATPQLSILLDRPGAGAALFPLINKKIKAKIDTLPATAAHVFRGLDELRLQWAGELVGNHDTQALGPNTIARIRMRFRTWSGPLVFHCHNVEHEDMRMMVNFEATMSGAVDELNTHEPNTGPAARSHGQDVTDLLTNPNAVGELPWEAIGTTAAGFPAYRWEEKPVPGTPVDEARDPLIKPREASK